MKQSLNGRVAIVTGASQGIGAAIARSLAAAGANTVVCARSKDALRTVVEQITQTGGNAISLSIDGTDPASVRTAIDATVERFRGLDILVNNVGGATKLGSFSELENEDWLQSFKLNVMSQVNFVRDALPWLRRSPAARIINISSISGLEPGLYNPHYTTTKAAVINLSKYLANELAGAGILVNVVCPGPVHSDAWDQNIERVAGVREITIEEARSQVEAEEIAKIPLARIGEGEDVASLVVYLASDQAKWITGSCFHVDGGKLRSMA